MESVTWAHTVVLPTMTKSLAATPLRRLLRGTAPVSLKKRGGFSAFRSKQGNAVFRGLTKRLSVKLFSKASLPRAKLHSTQSRMRGWKGANAGRRRGLAVDKQLTAIANATEKPSTRRYCLTTLALASLKAHGLDLICGQRGVRHQRSNIATAVDLICIHRQRRELWLVELKCGFEDVRSQVGKLRGREATFLTPFTNCPDSAEHRHMAQLATTYLMFRSEQSTLRQLEAKHDISRVRACVLYVCESGVDLIELPEWWKKRAGRMMETIG